MKRREEQGKVEIGEIEAVCMLTISRKIQTEYTTTNKIKL
jgi:hypothetical protein